MSDPGLQLLPFKDQYEMKFRTNVITDKASPCMPMTQTHLHQFPRAAVTNCSNYCDLKQQKCILSESEARNAKHKVFAEALGRNLFLFQLCYCQLPQLVAASLVSVTVNASVCTCLLLFCLLYKDTCHWIQILPRQPRVSSIPQLNHICKDPSPKHGNQYIDISSQGVTIQPTTIHFTFGSSFGSSLGELPVGGRWARGIFYKKLKVNKELWLHLGRWARKCLPQRKQVMTRPGGKNERWWPLGEKGREMGDTERD